MNSSPDHLNAEGHKGRAPAATPFKLILLFVAFMVFVVLNNALFPGARIDLTENQLYTLADGTGRLIRNIDEPITFRFFFSQQASEDLTALRAYAKRVQELLEEYQVQSEGKIHLEIIDPEPFSDEEDLAARFGLQSVPVNNAGDGLYFGLVGTNSVDDQQIISFFQPDKEEFLEYDISRLIQQLTQNQKPKVGLLSSLQVEGDINMTTFQTSPPWVLIDQLTAAYEVLTISPEQDLLPEDLALLVIIHPKSFSDSLLFAIDQFAMSGGRILLFVDPLAEMDSPTPGAAQPAIPSAPVSDFPLLSNWGLELRADMVLADAGAALNVGGANGQPVKHLGILGFSAANFNTEDVTLANLESINMATTGILDNLDGATSNVEVLISSSIDAMPMQTSDFQFLTDPEQLFKGFEATGERYTLAARLSGKAMSAFPEGIETAAKPGGQGPSEEPPAQAKSPLKETDNLNVIVVADTDLLTDRLWVQVQDFFGQTIASPWANNGDFVLNTVDNLIGGSELISIRSRGRFTRPFTVVEALRQEAQSRYQENADALQRELEQTESQLSELEQEQSGQNLLALSPEQEAAIARFQEEKLSIRKQLRDVRHQLDKDIDGLGATLKFINIALVPLLLTLALFGWSYLRRTRFGS